MVTPMDILKARTIAEKRELIKQAVPRTEPEPVAKSGGLTVKPWWQILPSTPTEAATRTIETPSVTPAGVVKSTTAKLVGAGIIAGGGLLAGMLLGGGGKQDQQQEITQEPDITPTVTPDMPIDIEPTVIPTVTPTIAPQVAPEISVVDSTVFGGIGATNIYEYLTTHQTTITNTITKSTMTTITPTTTTMYAGQEATQKQGLGLLEIAIIGGAVLGGAYLLKKK